MYTIEAIIGDKNIIKELEVLFQEKTSEIVINDKLSMLPITSDAFNSINQDVERRFLINGFSRLSFKMYSILLAYSKLGKIGYFEAEYFGGQGAQCSIAFQDLKEIYQEIQKSRSINKLLNFLGIECMHGKDEFDTIELGRYRSTEKWLIKK